MNFPVNYDLEELFPLVEQLAINYLGIDSTSLPYERAEQLMEAVLYCIHETEIYSGNLAASFGRLSARQAYDLGLQYAREKAGSALKLYHRILPEFRDWENRCLHDTVLHGIPEFFKWYDVKFQPQNTILTLDYPVLKDLSQSSGIDKIYEYLTCISLEQTFLGNFPDSFILKALQQHTPEYRDMVENICEIVYTAAVLSLLAKRTMSDPILDSGDLLFLQSRAARTDRRELEQLLKALSGKLIQSSCGNNPELTDYLRVLPINLAVRLKTAAEYGAVAGLL